MRLLLDSHILLWWDRDLSRLTKEQNESISNSSNTVFVSALNGWELGTKRSKGRLQFAGDVAGMLVRFGFQELEISLRHMEEAVRLEWRHRDPFDRILVAQAGLEGLTLVTADRTIRAYFKDCL